MSCFILLLIEMRGIDLRLYSAEFTERLTQLGYEDAGLLECREVASLGSLVPIEELRVDPVGPKLQRPVQLSGEDAYGHREVHLLSGEIRVETFGVDPRGGGRGRCQPVQTDVVEHVVARQNAFGIVIAFGPVSKLFVDPGGLADRRIGQRIA